MTNLKSECEKLLEICEEASPEPWPAIVSSKVSSPPGFPGVYEGRFSVGPFHFEANIKRAELDAKFISTARTTLPKLSRICMELEEACEIANDAINFWARQGIISRNKSMENLAEEQKEKIRIKIKNAQKIWEEKI